MISFFDVNVRRQTFKEGNYVFISVYTGFYLTAATVETAKNVLISQMKFLFFILVFRNFEDVSMTLLRNASTIIV